MPEDNTNTQQQTRKRIIKAAKDAIRYQWRKHHEHWERKQLHRRIKDQRHIRTEEWLLSFHAFVESRMPLNTFLHHYEPKPGEQTH